MPSGVDRQTDTHTYIPTCKPKQLQETRRAQPKAVHAWFKKWLNDSKINITQACVNLCQIFAYVLQQYSETSILIICNV